MSVGVETLGSTAPPIVEAFGATAPRVPPPALPAHDAHIPPLEIDRVELSSVAPPEAAAEVDLAYERALELAAQNRELHFARDEKGDLFVQVRDLEGNVIRTIPNSEVFDVLAGAEL